MSYPFKENIVRSIINESSGRINEPASEETINLFRMFFQTWESRKQLTLAKEILTQQEFWRVRTFPKQLFINLVAAAGQPSHMECLLQLYESEFNINEKSDNLVIAGMTMFAIEYNNYFMIDFILERFSSKFETNEGDNDFQQYAESMLVRTPNTFMLEYLLTRIPKFFKGVRDLVLINFICIKPDNEETFESTKLLLKFIKRDLNLSSIQYSITCLGWNKKFQQLEEEKPRLYNLVFNREVIHKKQKDNNHQLVKEYHLSQYGFYSANSVSHPMEGLRHRPASPTYFTKLI